VSDTEYAFKITYYFSTIQVELAVSGIISVFRYCILLVEDSSRTCSVRYWTCIQKLHVASRKKTFHSACKFLLFFQHL